MYLSMKSKNGSRSSYSSRSLSFSSSTVANTLILTKKFPVLSVGGIMPACLSSAICFHDETVGHGLNQYIISISNNKIITLKLIKHLLLVIRSERAELLVGPTEEHTLPICLFVNSRRSRCLLGEQLTHAFLSVWYLSHLGGVVTSSDMATHSCADTLIVYIDYSCQSLSCSPFLNHEPCSFLSLCIDSSFEDSDTSDNSILQAFFSDHQSLVVAPR